MNRPHDLRRLEELNKLSGTQKPSVIVGSAKELAAIHPRQIEHLKPGGVRVVVTDAIPGSPMPRFDKDTIHCTLPKLDEREEWRIQSSFIVNAIDLLTLKAEARRKQHDLEELTEIGVLLSSEKDTKKLLQLILTKSREITHSDAGSLYLVKESEGERNLWFMLAQNDSVALNLEARPLPLTDESLIGHVVLSGEPLVIDNAYEIDPDKPYAHNRWVDKAINYRTISMLAMPLKNLKGEVVGGLQLINRKRDFNIRLIDPLTAMVMVEKFDSHSINLVSSLASQAAVTLEKNMLYEAIQNLFEGFVKASVKAIESRDPTTSGHSERVAILTLKLAEAVNKTSTGSFAKVQFSDEELRELRYAGLLHDFGKVGVREQILVKAKKLYPEQKKFIEMKANFIKAAFQSEDFRKRLEFILKDGPDEFDRRSGDFDRDRQAVRQSLEEDLDFVWEANEPKILAEGDFDKLSSITEREYCEFEECQLRLIDQEEASILSIPKGTLTDDERDEIESHVTYSYNFLKEIPWTKEFKNIPDIAYKHHEKLNSRGYPRALASPEIPIQARMMTIADIFDALTASDRPYKRAVPYKKALQILTWEMEDGMLDPDLLDLFIKEKVYESVIDVSEEE